MSIDDLFILLARDEFSSPIDLEDFIIRDPDLGREISVHQGEAVLKGFEDLAESRQEALARTAWRAEAACSFSIRLLQACPWVRLIALSGSMAYRRTKREDDIDFFLVTRRNSVWVTLLLALLGARMDRLRHRRQNVFCFNRVLDEAECDRTFRSIQDGLFGREALSLTILDGRPYYRSLLKSADWMGRMYPRLYAKALGSHGEDDGRSRESPAAGSLVNGASFLLLAPYLVLVGLLRNRDLRRMGRLDASFRTVIRRGFFAYESNKYELLRNKYRESFRES